MSSSVARSAWVAVRSEPSHRAELVSQWLCGERLYVLDLQDGWLRCSGPDGYEGWASRGSLLELSDKEADAWADRALGYSLGTALLPEAMSAEAGRQVTVPYYLPWGARVQSLEGGGLELPGGVRTRAAEPAQIVPVAALPELFPSEGASVVRAARRWLGSPYLWGGRTRSGVDCSGFVQAIYAVHGIDLPRDSRDQAAFARCLPFGADMSTDVQVGDLLFFDTEGRGIDHVAIDAGNSIIHAAASSGCVVEIDLADTDPAADSLRESIIGRTRPLGSRRLGKRGIIDDA